MMGRESSPTTFNYVWDSIVFPLTRRERRRRIRVVGVPEVRMRTFPGHLHAMSTWGQE